MKITKHGTVHDKKDSKKETFKCGNCGCEFSAKEDEYYVDLGAGGDNSSFTNITITASMFHTVVKDYLVCSCPECHKIVKKIRERNCEPGGTVVYDAADVSATWTCEDALSEALLLK